MDPVIEAQEQTQQFIDSARATPGRLIHDRVEQTQNELIRARMQKHVMDERIAWLESSVALLQGEVPPKKTWPPKWVLFAAAGLGLGGVSATHPYALAWGAFLYLFAAMCFGAIAMPVLLFRRPK